MTPETHRREDEETLDHLLDALSEATLRQLADLHDAQAGVAEWTIATMGLGPRAALHAYGAIIIGESVADEASSRGIREIELRPLGRRLIAAAAERYAEENEVAVLRRQIDRALAAD